MKKNDCKHPKAYISKIGKYSVCNICGQKFFEDQLPKDEKKDELVIESKVENIEPVEELHKVDECVEVVENIEPEAVIEVQDEPVEVEKPKRKYKKKKIVD